MSFASPRPFSRVIARIWHGTTRRSRALAYLAFLNQRAIPDYRSTPGNLAAWLLVRVEGERAHFLALSLWESEAAIRAFAGPDVSTPKYYPQDVEFLDELEPRVVHYEVVGTVPPDVIDVSWTELAS